MLDTARELKERGAKNVIVCCTFGLFTSGYERFDEAYAKEYFDLVVTTNLNYKPQDIYTRDWYMEANISRYLAAIINSFNYDMSVQGFSNAERIQRALRAREAEK